MRKRHDAESCKDGERYSKAAAVLPTVDTNNRSRLRIGGGRGRRGQSGASCPRD